MAQWLSICLWLRAWSWVLGFWDWVPYQVPCREPASPSVYVSASLCLSWINKTFKKKKKYILSCLNPKQAGPKSYFTWVFTQSSTFVNAKKVPIFAYLLWFFAFPSYSRKEPEVLMEIARRGQNQLERFRDLGSKQCEITAQREGF